MKKSILTTTAILFVVSAAINAHSRNTTITEDTILTVRDHAGNNFLVLKVDECSLGNKGEVICAMTPEKDAQPIQAGPKGGFWDRLRLK